MNLRIRPVRLRKTQLRTRVLAGVLAVTLAALASFGYGAVTVLHRDLLTNTDANLKTTLTDIQPIFTRLESNRHEIKPPAGTAKQDAGILTIPRFLDDYGVEFRTGQGPPQEIVRGNPDLVPQLPGDLTALAARDGSETVMSNGRTELRLMAASGPEGTLIVTTSLESVNSTIGWLTIIVIVGMLVVVLIVFAGVGLVVRRGLRPVQTMAATADKITGGDLNTRVNPDEQETEVGRLGAALNGMLARIQAAVDEREAHEQAIRQFFADASHELRTPLASLRANAELYQQGALLRRADVDEAMRRIASEARRMGILVDDMLRLARLDQHPRQNHKPVDLTALITECVERARIASPDRTWHSRTAPCLVTNGDEEMLRRVIDNLLANVVTHTPPGTTAAILGTASDRTVTIEVSDNGPGVEASQLPRIFDRFYRAPARTSTHGSGLGLAIVAAIATAHEGTVEAAVNYPRGLRVTLTLPLPSQPGTTPPAPWYPRPSSYAGRLNRD